MPLPRIPLFLIFQTAIFSSFAAELELRPTRDQIDSAGSLARCRAHCIDAFSYRFAPSDQDDLNNGQCLADTDCWMCWDYCELFQTDYSNWVNMCKQPPLCFEGCRIVCALFASGLELDLYQPSQWSFPFLPTVKTNRKAGWLRLDWPDAVPLALSVPPLPHVVYVIFWRPAAVKPWIQLEHTLSTFYETRHGDIVIAGNEGRFLILAVTRDGIVAYGVPEDGRTSVIVNSTISISNSPSIELISDQQVIGDQASAQFVLAIVGSSLLASVLFSLGLLVLYRVIRAQRRRDFLARGYAIRFRFRSRQNRKRHTSASSRTALTTALDVDALSADLKKAIQPVASSTVDDTSDRANYEELFKGTIFESPPPYSEDHTTAGRRWPRFSFISDHIFHFDVSPSFTV